MAQSVVPSVVVPSGAVGMFVERELMDYIVEEDYVDVEVRFEEGE
jgi:hypothetical protein